MFKPLISILLKSGNLIYQMLVGKILYRDGLLCSKWFSFDFIIKFIVSPERLKLTDKNWKCGGTC